ncbi:MAG: hypothetical protein AAFN79_17795 [Pseudomonadota bacterium]
MAEDLVFIMSGGRTGTKFLGDLLGEVIADCHSEHEPDLFLGFDRLTVARIRRFGLWHMVVGRALGRAGVRVTGMRFLKGEISLEAATASFRRQRARYHAETPERMLIESNYPWWMVAPHLGAHRGAIFPGAKAIGVVRDPRAWIASWAAHQAGRDRGHWTHRLPPGPLTPMALRDEEWAARWEEIGAVGRLAWQWRRVTASLAAAEDAGAARVYRFEDLFSEDDAPMAGLVEDICDFGDRRYRFEMPPGFRARPRNASAARDGDWREWSAAERAAANELCEPFLARYGYEAI